MDRKQTVLSLINDDNYVPMRFEDIAAILCVPQDELNKLEEILVSLENDGKIILTRKNKYIATNPNEFIKGVFSSKDKGFGFVITETTEDIFISADNTNSAMHGDKVLVQIVKKADKLKKSEGKVYKILNRANNLIVGTFTASKDFGFVVPDNKKISTDIYIPKKFINNAKNKQKVVVKINKWPTEGKKPEGEISEIIGYTGDSGVDVKSVLRRYGIYEEFCEEINMELKKIYDKILPDDIKGRKDFRNNTVITIDGADSKDLDDAISVTKSEDKYTLAVHIADVSHYVTENSFLDKEALKRGTSVYFPGSVIPMLPRKLSNGICSLNPGEDRLTLSVVLDIDFNGNITDYTITEGIINSCERMTYDDVTLIIDGDKILCNKYAHIKDDIMNMYDLSQILSNKRKLSGSIDFDFPETKIIVDADGKPIDVYKHIPEVSNGIIEEFMLIANKTVAENFFWLELPFIYRVHEKPSKDKLTDFNAFLKPMNLSIKSDEPHSMDFAKMLNNIKGTDKEMLISKVMLRSLMKAKYSPENSGHFGLAFKYYCHFTSPIRRYPDLVIHRIIKEYLKSGLSDQRITQLTNFVNQAAEKSSIAELNAMEAERTIEDIKKAEYMKHHIGEKYDAIICSVTSFGFFAELQNGIQGLVHVTDLVDDYYIYDNTNYTLIGEYSGKTYKIGDKIKIEVISANTSTSQIDFYPVEEKYYEQQY